MKAKDLFFITVLAFVLLNVEVIRACTCVQMEPCEAFSNADIVFVGTVISSRDKMVMTKFSEEDEKAFPYRYQLSRFRVEKIYFGTKSKEVFVTTDLSTSCSWRLKVGDKYLIYGTTSDKGTFSTSYCAGSTSLKDEKADLEYLNLIPKNGTTISGTVLYSPTGGRYNYSQQKEVDFTNSQVTLLKLGVTSLLLESKDNKFQTEIKSDGTYQFVGIPKGKYKLTPILPDSLAIKRYRDEEEIEVSGHGCSLENFLVTDNGRLSGKITDSDGKPVKGITVTLVPKDNELNRNYSDFDLEGDLNTETDENGNYQYKGLLAGEYWVGTRLGEYVGAETIDAAYPTTFFPGVADKEKARYVKIESGKAVERIDFILLPKLKERTIKGRVFFPNGRPAPKIFVRYVARTPDRKDCWIVFIHTDVNGYFSFIGYEGNDYLIGAFTDERQGNKHTFAVEQEIFVKGEVNELKFILDRKDDDKCKECKDYSDFPKQK